MDITDITEELNRRYELDTVLAWEEATQELVKVFTEKYYKDDPEIGPKCFWVAGIVGDVFFINDDYWNVNDMLLAISNNASKKDLFDWYNGSIEASLEDRTFPNLKHYLMGAR